MHFVGVGFAMIYRGKIRFAKFKLSCNVVNFVHLFLIIEFSEQCC
jgi:hypothetical protein